MAKNLKLFFDTDGSPRARGPASEKLLMEFLESDVQGSDHICHDLMDDITAIEDESAESREFVGNAHSIVISADGVTIECTIEEPDSEHGSDDEPSDKDTAENSAQAKKSDSALKSDPAEKSETTDKASTTKTSAAQKIAEMPSPTQYKTGLKHFREVLEDWEAFILDDQSPT